MNRFHWSDEYQENLMISWSEKWITTRESRSTTWSADKYLLPRISILYWTWLISFLIMSSFLQIWWKVIICYNINSDFFFYRVISWSTFQNDLYDWLVLFKWRMLYLKWFFWIPKESITWLVFRMIFMMILQSKYSVKESSYFNRAVKYLLNNCFNDQIFILELLRYFIKWYSVFKNF